MKAPREVNGFSESAIQIAAFPFFYPSVSQMALPKWVLRESVTAPSVYEHLAQSLFERIIAS